MLRNKYTNRFEFGKSLQKIYRPVFFRLADPDQAMALETLIQSHSELQITDEIKGQLQEYLKLLQPSQKPDQNELDEMIKTQLNGKSMDEYGVWIYYEWNNKLIHILDEQEFIAVRTNRNKYKITDDEQNLLATKKVGIIGLSVGQSVALTLAMERGFGELRLADFDDLELTNFNRIRTGLHNLGHSKTITTAREIAEIDPYLKITCFLDGIKENNIDAFFSDGGKLDVVIDECDELDIKVLCRVKAKHYRVAVVMEMSDRCMIDIERYDIDPEIVMFQGAIEHLDLKNLKNLSTEQKIPYMLPMVGGETISDRLKVSALEVGLSISTWPQLASAVVMGGGVSADIVRRILLEQFHESGRFFIDVEDLIGGKKKQDDLNIITAPALEIAEMKRIAGEVSSTNEAGYELSEEEIKRFTQQADKAPSYANTRPWQWLWHKNNLFLFHDRSRSAGFYDIADHASLLSMGACCENLKMIAEASGYSTDIVFHSDKATGINFAKIKFAKANVKEDPLLTFINERKSFRTLAAVQPIPEDALMTFGKYAEKLGLDLHLITSPQELVRINSILAEAHSIYFLNKYAHKEFYSQHLKFRQPDETITESGFIVPNESTSDAELAALKIARGRQVNSYLKEWKLGNLYRRLGLKSTYGANAIGIITAPGHSKADFFRMGLSIQNLWLKATQMKFGILPINYITSLQLRIEEDQEKYLEPSDVLRIKRLRQDLNQTFTFLFENNIIFVFKLAKKYDGEVG